MRKQGAVLSPSGDMRDGHAQRSSPSLPGRQSAAQAGTGAVDPLAQLARLIAQDETFQATTRTGGRFTRRAELTLDQKDAPSLADARENIWPGHDGDGEEPYQDAEYVGPDVANPSPNRRRGLRLFVALFGLALAGAASVAGYWLWADALTTVDKAPASVASLTAKALVPSPVAADSRSGAALPHQSDEQSVKGTDRVVPTEERLPEADAAAAAPRAPQPAGIFYGPASPQAGAPTPAAAPPSSLPGSAPDQAPPSNETAATQAAPEATNPGAAPEVSYVVQLSSQRSEAAAQITSKLLQTKYAELFAGREPFIRRSDLGGRGVYYRVLIGPLATAEARQFCGNLKKSGGDCVVQKN
jgi:SPOR domain